MKTQGIFKRNVPIFIGMYLIIILATAVTNYMGSSIEYQEQASSINIALLNQISNNVDMILHTVDSQTLNFMQDPKLNVYMYQNYNNNDEKYATLLDLQNKISSMKDVNNYIDSIYVYSLTDGMILNESRHTSVHNFHDVQWIEDFGNINSLYMLKSTRKVNGDKVSGENGKNVITLIRPYPLTNYKSNFKGAVAVNINEDVLYSIISKEKNERLFNIFMTDSVGQVLSHENKNELYANYKDKNYMQTVLDSKKSGHIQNKAENKDSFIFYTTSAYTGWKYVSVVPVHEINKSFGKVKNMLIFIAILMCSLAVIFIMYVMNKTFRPIDGFINTVVEKIKTTNLPEKEDYNLGTIQELENVFGNMLTDHQKMQGQIKDYLPVMRWRLFMDILMGYRSDYGNIDASLSSFGIFLYSGSYVVMVAEIDDKDGSEEVNKKSVEQLKAAICSQCEKVVNQEGRGAAVELYEDKIAILISFEQYDENKNMILVLSIGEIIKNYVAEHLKTAISIGIGSLVRELKDLNLSYMEAMEALKYKVLMGDNSTISIEDIRGEEEPELYQVASVAATTLDVLKSGNEAKIRETVEKIFDDAVQKSISPDMVYQLSMHLIIQGMRILKDSGVDLYKLTKDNEGNKENSIYKMLNQCKTIEKMKECIIDRLIYFSEIINEHRAQRTTSRLNTELVNKVMEYIQANYMRYDLSLNSLADTFNISTTYLSKLFKETVEMNFIDYLIYMRLEKAKDLLGNSNIKINEVAEKVGYSSLPSFIRIFKKYTDKTPSEYRKEKTLEM